MSTTDPYISTGELYACNGHYDAVHDEVESGCGTVYSFTAGLTDIHTEDVDFGDDRTETYLLKGTCPVCGLDEVVLIPAGVLPVVR